jgi:hypothetical protein
MAEPLSHKELLERLERRVCGPEGQGHAAYLFKEVNLDNRRADAISVGLWHSRGHKIESFEAKASRRDWLLELQDPQKAEPAMAIADHHWLVTNPDVLQPGELPDSWGLLLSAGRRRHLRVEKPAPLLREEPTVIDRGLLANFIRHAATLSMSAEYDIRKRVRAEEQERVGSGADVRALERRAQLAEEHAQRLSDAYEEFKRTSGFDFLLWSPGAEEMAVLGAAARALRSGPAALRRLLADVQRQEDVVVRHRKSLKGARGELQKALDEFA